VNRFKEWKIGEPGSEEVIHKNLQMMDGLFAMLEKSCSNEFCQYPISAIRMECFAVPNVGDVCATCYGMYQAISIMNPKLRHSQYFQARHNEWKREIEDFKRWRRKNNNDDERG
jgi:hypothetical protein